MICAANLAMSYWDTSAFAKLYLPEPDRAAFLPFAAGRITTAHLTQHELRTVFHRREAEGSLAIGAAALLYQDFESDIRSGLIGIVEESALVRTEFAVVLERCFATRPPVFIRTNDALHIATARVAGQSEFVSADLKQRQAAHHVGLKVLP